MKTNLCSLLVAGAVIFTASALVAAAATSRPQLADPNMAGHWTGRAKIIVDWTVQRDLSVDVVIAPDGSVTGRIGEATLQEATLQSNRGWLGRQLNLATDWIIIGNLTGDLIAAESVHRPAVKIPLHWQGAHFTGAVHSSGSKMGGKESMILTAAQLTLRKSGDRR